MRTVPSSSAPLRQAGMSLIELMVAMVISVVLMLGVVSLFSASRTGSSLETAIAGIQENERFATNVLTAYVREAGNYGCISGSSSLTSLINGSAGNFFYDFTQGINGYEAAQTEPGRATQIYPYLLQGMEKPGSIAYETDIAPNTPDLTTATLVTGGNILSNAISPSDVLVVREGTSSTLSNVLAPYATPSATALSASAVPATVQPGSFAVITNCVTGTAFQITGITPAPGSTTATPYTVSYAVGVGTPGNSQTGLGQTYGAGSILVSPNTIVLYVGKALDGTEALMQASLVNSTTALQTQELVSDVENMQILYGIDTTGTKVPAYYTTADQVPLWSEVVSVRIGLLMKSQSQNYHDVNKSIEQAGIRSTANTTPINVNGTWMLPQPNDYDILRVLILTIGIRNRTQ